LLRALRQGSLQRLLLDYEIPLVRMEAKLGEPHAGELRRETAEAKGE
jgi:hypothetical protein